MRGGQICCAGGFRRLRAATFFFRGEKEGKTPPGTAQGGHSVPTFAFPRTPLRGTLSCFVGAKFPARKICVTLRGSIRPHWGPACAKFKLTAVQELRLSFHSHRFRCKIAFPWGKVPNVVRRMRGTAVDFVSLSYKRTISLPTGRGKACGCIHTSSGACRLPEPQLSPTHTKALFNREEQHQRLPAAQRQR